MGYSTAENAANKAVAAAKTAGKLTSDKAIEQLAFAVEQLSQAVAEIARQRI